MRGCEKIDIFYSKSMVVVEQVPYLRVRQESKFPRIEVGADSMRVGKTTAVQVIAEGLHRAGYPVFESYEDWQNNPYLKGSYEDPEKNFVESQKWFIKRKWEQVKEGATEAVFLQDVHPEMDYCYALTSARLGRISWEHFRTYHEFYVNLDWSEVPAPDLLVYLAIGDKELIRRAIDSKREFEEVDKDYYLEMKKVNRKWLAGVGKKMEVLVVDTNMLDYAHDEEAKRYLEKKVLRKLKLS